MDYGRILANSFKNDLNMIDDYITFILCNPQAAINMSNKFESAIITACRHPKIAPMYKTFRKIVVDNYLLFFEINEKTQTLIFHRAIYGRMDYEKFV